MAASDTLAAPPAARSAALAGRYRPAWERMVRHPFVLALGDGTLPRTAFADYMRQDYLFIDGLARLTAAGIERSPGIETAKPLGTFLQTLLGAEDDLFKGVFHDLGLAWPLPPVDPLPQTLGFQALLRRLTRRGSFAEISCALYVTEGTYADWAGRLVAEGRLPADPLYRAWIDIHADPSLAEFASFLGGCVDAADGAEETALQRVFARALTLETAFWGAFYPVYPARGAKR